MGEVEEELRSQEFDEVVKPRRAAAGVRGDPAGSWGLALSGGGIRSATFCLGLVRGLARNGILRQFDYLSTVSGGGYLGASLGRLFGPGHSAKEVECGVASDDSLWLWWLRSNGRYLTPTGTKDLGFAAASICRGIFATHLEVGAMLVILAACVLLPHALIALGPPGEQITFWSSEFVGRANSIWWWALPLPLLVIAHQAISYWYTKDEPTLLSNIAISLASLGGGYLAWNLLSLGLGEFSQGRRSSEDFSMPTALCALVGALVLSATASSWLAVMWDRHKGTSPAKCRLARTKKLSFGMWAFMWLAAIALLDLVSWEVARFAWKWAPEGLSLGKAALVGIALAAGRFVIPEVQKRMAVAKRPSLNVEKMLNALGIILLLCVLLLWTTLLHLAMFSQWAVGPALGAQLGPNLVPLKILGTVGAVAATYVLLSCASFELLNLASLHHFYRARIERAYVSSGNFKGTAQAQATRDGYRFPKPPFEPGTVEDTLKVAPLTEAIEDDDLNLEKYAPHAHGGPVHLINCCINQSVDDRTGVYNADRKGVALTVSALGVETGPLLPRKHQFIAPPGTLSRWIAISGAAASTGMGSRTSPGFAALLFLSGIRLGYWTKSLMSDTRDRGEETGKSNGFARWFPKPLAIISESLARFPGIFSPMWYVSDGGHFDNTGVYALLKRRCRLVVAADCGADPKYLFADLESLVRKAKIDYAATIEFIDPDQVSERLSPELRCALGTPETITPEAASRWLVLGRIKYQDGTEGTLVVVKPRRLDRMPFDIVAYADRNQEFPQQTTGDQFFDEAQWEAYHQLGCLLGGRVTKNLLKNAIAAVEEMTHAPSSLTAVEANSGPASPQSNRRTRVGLTVGASLGAGLSLSVVLALWQGVEKYREARHTEEKEFNASFVALRDRINDRAQFEALTVDDFTLFAKKAKKLKSGQFDVLKDQVKAKCNEIQRTSKTSKCDGLATELDYQPPVMFDYWLYRPADDEVSEVVTAMVGVIKPLNEWFIELVEGLGSGSDTPRLGTGGEGRKIPPACKVASFVQPALPAATAVTRVAATPALAGAVAAIVRPGLPPMPLQRDACRLPGNQNARVYLHIYDEANRPEARQLGLLLTQQLGMAAPPVENVVATAMRRGTDAPFTWQRLAIVYHAGVSDGCVSAVSSLLAGRDPLVRKLPGKLKGNPGLIEIWVPPDQ